MNSQIRTLVDAAQKDDHYWLSITEESGSSEENTTTSFYISFLEGIINSLNAVYAYHHPEEFIGRFLERVHVFALQENEFTKVADDLVDEMVASGNSPVSSISRNLVVKAIVNKMTNWYYMLDAIEEKDFNAHKRTILDILAYDINTVFHPSHLDSALLAAYESQFTIISKIPRLLLYMGKQISMSGSYSYYLLFMYLTSEKWIDATVAERVALITQLSKEISRSIPEITDQKMASEMHSVRDFYKQYGKTTGPSKRYFDTYKLLYTFISTADIHKHDTAKQITNIMNSTPGFGSNDYDSTSVEQYVEAKLVIWRALVSQENRHIVYTVMTHDIMNSFAQTEIDTQILSFVKQQAQIDASVMRVIAGTSLKFSSKFIAYSIFKKQMPDWDSYSKGQMKDNAILFVSTLEHIKATYKKLKVIPKSEYAPLTKSFTTFFTFKKIIEIYFQRDQEMGNLEERSLELYKELFKGKKDPAKTTEEQIAALLKHVEANPKKVSEDVFDEVIFLALQQEINSHKFAGLADLLEDEKLREKFHYIIFKRFDAFTFNRIMATNLSGLGNLFGTKGFIILIEAYLIGSGLEHTINYFVYGSVGTAANIWQYVVNDGSSLPATIISPWFDSILPDHAYDFSPAAFGTGWAQVDWGKTGLSLFIPIFLMFLITSYNYLFYKLNREGNREKSFQRIVSNIKRWIEEKKHAVTFEKKRRRGFHFVFELFKIAVLVYETVYIIVLLYEFGFEPTQLALFFFLLATICLSAYQGNKLKDEVTLGQSETISDTIRDFIFIPIIELGKYLGGRAKSINFIPWLVKTGVEPIYKPIIGILHSFINFQRDRKEEIL